MAIVEVAYAVVYPGTVMICGSIRRDFMLEKFMIVPILRTHLKGKALVNNRRRR